jgi:hypothetical protein
MGAAFGGQGQEALDLVAQREVTLFLESVELGFAGGARLRRCNRSLTFAARNRRRGCGANGHVTVLSDISQAGDVEIELQAIGVTRDAKQAAHRVVWPQNDGAEVEGNGLQLFQVGGSLSEQKIDVDGGDGRTL